MMKALLTLVLGVALLATPACAGDKVDMKDNKAKAGYSIGVDIGNNLKRQGLDVNPAALAQGIKDAMSGAKTRMTESEMRETLEAFKKEMIAKQTEQAKAAGDKNKKEGEAFLAENKTKPGIKTLPDGLQYKVITEGGGKTPKATDTVTVNYRGTLIDGTEFDSSYKRGTPASFQVSGVIRGWTEALQLMKTGSKWQLFIPSELAYGERGAGHDIGPNSTLIFEVELLSIK